MGSEMCIRDSSLCPLRYNPLVSGNGGVQTRLSAVSPQLGKHVAGSYPHTLGRDEPGQNARHFKSHDAVRARPDHTKVFRISGEAGLLAVKRRRDGHWRTLNGRGGHLVGLDERRATQRQSNCQGDWPQ